MNPRLLGLLSFPNFVSGPQKGPAERGPRQKRSKKCQTTAQGKKTQKSSKILFDAFRHFSHGILSSTTRNQPKEEVFRTDIPRTSGGHLRGYPGPKLRSGPSKLWKNMHFGADIHDPKARTSTTPRGFQKLRSEKLWAEFSFPISSLVFQKTLQNCHRLSVGEVLHHSESKVNTSGAQFQAPQALRFRWCQQKQLSEMPSVLLGIP